MAAMPVSHGGDAKAVMPTAALAVPELQCHGGNAHGNNPTMVMYTAVVPKVALPTVATLMAVMLWRGCPQQQCLQWPHQGWQCPQW